MNRRSLLITLALLLWAGALAQTLDAWSWRTEDVEAYNELFRAYEEANPGVDINFEAFLNTEYNTLTATSLQAGEAGDVVMTRSYGGVQGWIDGGYLVPLTPESVPNLANYSDTALNAIRGREDGQVYGVPFAIQTLQVFYNKGIFDELGLSEPTTWDEFLALNQALLDAGYIPLAITGRDAWMLPIFHTIVGAGVYGGDEFVAGILDGSRTFEDPAFVESLQAVKDLQPFMPPDVTAVSYTDTQALFVNEMAAMFPGGSWEAGYFRGQNPDLELGVFAVPAKGTNEQLVSWFVDGSWAVTTSADDQDAALAFVNWLASPEYAQAYSNRLLVLSPVAGVTPEDELLGEITEMWNENPTDYMLLVHFRYGTPTGTDVIGSNIQNLLLGSVTPAEVAADLQAQMSSWFTPETQD
jgi:raffinose/stachyose/melibiose transport system substrate-binding protein